MKKYTRGFTLIELLVVIAIIGILASVVLVSLNSARSKGKDARVQAELAQIRTQIESDYNGNYNNSFSAAHTLVNTGNYGTLTSDIAAQGATVNAITNAAAPFTAYALYATIQSTSATDYYCIDSTGRTNNAAPTNNTVTCP